MTPGWTNVRNGLAESGRPRALVSMRAWTFVKLAIVSLLLWLGIAAAVRSVLP
jgi:hypothetical protein